MWLGDAQQNGRGIVGGTWGQRSNIYGTYVQDDWRVSSTLTLNIGLRFQAHTPWGEVHGQQDNFGLFSGTPEFASAKDIPAGVIFPGNQPVITGNSALYNGYYGITDWQPRLGIAWTPEFLHGKTVFRASYTTSDYLEGTGTNLRLPLNPPFGTEDFTDYSTYRRPTPDEAVRRSDAVSGRRSVRLSHASRLGSQRSSGGCAMNGTSAPSSSSITQPPCKLPTSASGGRT